jgi:hypothetical protein
MTLTTLAPPSTAVHLLRLDYPTHTAQIIDPHGRTVAIYSHVGGRDAACARVAADGWELAPGEWVITSPPDGREHPIRRAPAHP